MFAACAIASTEARAQAKDYNCVPLSVLQLNNRVEVECAEPASKTRGSYPVDTCQSIRYFKVPLTSPETARRFVQLSNLALVAGMPMRFTYLSGDYSGEVFGCERANCRTPTAFAIVKTTSVPILEGPTLVWQGTWNPGWTSLVPFELDGQPYLLGYMNGSGRVAIDRFNSDGMGTTQVWPPPGANDAYWKRGWTSLVPISLDNKPHLFAYMRGSGRVAIDRFNSDGMGTTPVWPLQGEAFPWSKGWTSIFPMVGGADVISYKLRLGDLHVDRISYGGTTSRWKRYLQPGVPLRLVVYSIGSTNYLLQYGPSGWAYSFLFGVHSPPAAPQAWGEEWSRDWTHFAPFRRCGKTFLLSYMRINGVVEIKWLHGDGKGLSRAWPSAPWQPGWTSLVSFQLNNRPHFLLYDRGKKSGGGRDAAIYRIDD